jgi:hypothetical protein
MPIIDWNVFRGSIQTYSFPSDVGSDGWKRRVSVAVSRKLVLSAVV